VLSAAGIQTSVIPTAMLSTHTGGFTGYTFRDLTDDILPIAKHWNGLGLKFDAIYTGFLGSLEQVDIVLDALSLLRSEDTIVVVDPVMADFGKLYTIFNKDFPSAMRKLCAEADVIVPNLTEAALLTGAPYSEGPFERSEVEAILRALAGLGPSCVALTGVTYADNPDVIGAASFESRAPIELGSSCDPRGSSDPCGSRASDTSGAGGFAYSGAKRITPMYHGTGDVFASVLTAALINGKSLSDSCAAAVKFTVDAIKRTKDAETDNRFGVDFESGLCKLKELLASY
jgi:pyridoxine kinase